MKQNAHLSFGELRCKEVINSVDGKRLGRIIDLVFSACGGHIEGIVVPHCRRNIIFRQTEPIFIPWKCVKKIGADIILVDLVTDHNGKLDCHGGRHDDHHDDHDDHHDHHDDHHDHHDDHHCQPPRCDHRCEKCMLFDCGFRWKRSLGR